MSWDKSDYEKKKDQQKIDRDTDAVDGFYEIQKFLLLDFPMQVMIGAAFESGGSHESFDPVVYVRSNSGWIDISSHRSLLDTIREAKVILNCKHEFGDNGWCTICTKMHTTRWERINA